MRRSTGRSASHSAGRQPPHPLGHLLCSARPLLVLLCIVLVLFIGVAQVLHTHTSNPVNEAQNPNCSLCTVAHLAAIPVPVPNRPVAVETITPVRAPDQAQPPPRPFHFVTSIRPPPAL